MSIALSDPLVPSLTGTTPPAEDRCAAAETSTTMKRWFGVELAIMDMDSREMVHTSQDQPGWDPEPWLELARAAAQRGTAEVIHEAGPVVVLAVPCVPADTESSTEAAWVALGLFLVREQPTSEELLSAAASLGIEAAGLQRWARRQTLVAVETLERLAALVLAEQTSHRRVVQLEAEIGKLSRHVCDTYEEISLIHQLSGNLSLSHREDDLARQALKWLRELIPARGLVLQRAGNEGRLQPQLLIEGDCPIGEAAFAGLIDHLGLNASRRLLVANRTITDQPSWPQPDVREMIVVPLVEEEEFFGWLAAFNHTADGEFGSVEANLLSSVSVILGVHRGNAQLYRGQAELLCDMVQALTSAIDAKDPYTRGHSDRVARVAVRLARELGCDKRTVETLYLSGLVHDVGKIGIEDQVLRKPGRLTQAEYEHIKMHPQLGYNILSGIKQLGPVLPVVLHHHEAWDGSGYPHGLAGDDIPYLARIAAVADAFDAMGSDRVYRQSMSDERLDTIIREGAGRQWDAGVVAAFFRAREDIREITRRERDDDVPKFVNLFLS